MSDTGYKVRLEGAGLTLERHVGKSVGEEIAVLILRADSDDSNTDSTKPGGERAGSGGAQAMAAASAPPRTAVTERGRSQLSVREFLDLHEPKRVPDKITVIGLHLQDHQGRATFSRQDVAGAFEAAAERVPANLYRDLTWAVKAGWIAPKTGEKGTYYVTKMGREAATGRFPAAMLKRTRIDAGRKRSGKKAAEA
jgi:hypothetical protein